MPDRPLSDFLHLVLPYTPNCPEFLAEQSLRLAAVDFCAGTRCWRHVETTTLVSAAAPTQIAIPSYATIHAIESAFWETDNALTPTPYSDLDARDTAADAPQGLPQLISQVTDGYIVVVPFQPGNLRITAYLKPKSGSEYGVNGQDTLQDANNMLPEFMFLQHADAIAAGAIARICMIPEEAFSNVQVAAAHASKFQAAITERASDVVRGQQRAPARSVAQYF